MLSTTAEYALRALLSLASEPDKATLGRDLAASSGVPANYLSKILLELKKGGFVQAVRGTGGGYRLGRPPEEVRLMDVVEFVDGAAARPGCFLAGSDACSDDDPCLAHDRWAAVRDQYVAFLESTTLADVSEHPNRQPLATPTDSGSTPHE
jgi:Rrf2 family iron-sulfur cluster assembly transcriptional regulator